MCSETRELWKKTGAWFYKGLPNYELPPTRINTRFRSNDEMLSTSRMQRLTMEYDETASSSGSENGVDTMSPSRPKHRLKLANGGGRAIDNKLNLFLNNERHSSMTDLKRLDYDTVSQASSTAQSFTNNKRSSVSSSFSVCDSSSLPGYGSDTLNMNSPFRDPVVGWLEISVAYDESNHCLNCVILRARDLPAMDASGMADPFCKANVITTASPGYEQLFKYAKWVKTKVVPRTTNPEFNEPFSFMGLGPDEIELSILYVLVLDNDKYGHDLLGIGKFKLHSLLVSINDLKAHH